jgi:hypothetical protein
MPFADSLSDIGTFKWDAYLKGVAIDADTKNNYSIMVPYVNKQNVLEGYIDINVTKTGVTTKPTVYNYAHDYLDNKYLLQRYMMGSPLQFFSQKGIILPQSLAARQIADKKQIVSAYTPKIIEQTDTKAISNGPRSLATVNMCQFTFLINYNYADRIAYEDDNSLRAQINSQYLLRLQGSFPPSEDIQFSITDEGLVVSGPSSVTQNINTTGILTSVLLQVNGVISVNSVNLISGSCSVPSGGGNYPPASAAEVQDAVAVDNGNPGINPQTYIICFSDGKTAQSYKLTIYVDQPIPGSNDEWTTGITANTNVTQNFINTLGQTFNVGHTFVGFEKINTDGTSVTQVMGFYPTHGSVGGGSSGGSSAGASSNGKIEDNSGHQYNVSYTVNVNASQFNSALSGVVNSSASQYVLSNVQSGPENNCTDAAVAWMRAAGVTLPAGGAGLFVNDPGDFGQALTNVTGASTTPGNAPTGHGACN